MKLSTYILIAAIAGSAVAIIITTIWICVGGSGITQPTTCTLGGMVYTRELPQANKIAVALPRGGTWGVFNGNGGVRIIGSDTITAPILEAREQWQKSITDSVTPDGTLLLTWDPEKIIPEEDTGSWIKFESIDSIPVTIIVPRTMLESAELTSHDTNSVLYLENLSGKRLKVRNNDRGLGINVTHSDIDTLDVLPCQVNILAIDSSEIDILNLILDYHQLTVVTDNAKVGETLVSAVNNNPRLDLSEAQLGKVVLTGEKAGTIQITLGPNELISR